MSEQMEKKNLEDLMEETFHNFVPPKNEIEAKKMMVRHLMSAVMSVMTIKNHPAAASAVIDAQMIQLMSLAVYVRKMAKEKTCENEGTDTVLRQ